MKDTNQLTYHGKLLEAVTMPRIPYEPSTCTKCALNDDDKTCAKYVCSRHHRSDKRDVIFVEKE
jgi:hypothetical protein